MIAAPPNNRLILTTETLSGLGWRVLRLLALCGLAVAITLLGYAGRERTIDFQAVLALALMQFFMVGVGVFCN